MNELNFNICWVEINPFYKIYEDLIDALVQSFNDLGHNCTVKRNGFSEDAINIFLGSTFLAARHRALARKMKGRSYIVFQLEPLDNRLDNLLPEYWELLRNAAAIWDYAPSNVDYLKAKGFENVFYVPPAFHRCMESFRQKVEPDIDVLFVGSPHPRRARIIEKLKSRGVGVVYLQSAFGETRNRYIARSRIVLNIHAWDVVQILETVRVSFLLANRTFVISEESFHNPYGDGVVYAPYDRLVEVCIAFLQDSQARQEVAENGYFAVRKLDMVEILRATLDEMGKALLASCVLLSTESLNSYYSSRSDLVHLIPKSAKRILDIGCGSGLVGENIKKRQDCHVTGVEIFPDAVNRAAQLLDLAICGDAFSVLPSLPQSSYDCVLMLDVLEHVVETAELLRLAVARLTDDGVLVLSVPNVGHWSVIQGLIEGRWDYADQGLLDRAHLRFFTLSSLLPLLQEAGVEVVKLESTRVGSMAPAQAFVEAMRHFAAAGGRKIVNMEVFQFILLCRKI